MAYNGYLIKVIKKNNSGTDYVFPMNLIVEKTYKMTYSVMDSQAKRNAKGKLKRVTMPHKVPHCSVQLRELNNTQLAALLSEIQARYTVKKQKKVKLSVFIPEIDDYKEEDFYLPDIDITINHIESSTIKYEPITLEFIGY